MTDVELDERVTALEESGGGGGNGQNGEGSGYSKKSVLLNVYVFFTPPIKFI